jgi:hypothetical protein
MADAPGVQGRVIAACLGWHAYGALRDAVLGGGSTALSRMCVRPGAARHVCEPHVLWDLRPLGAHRVLYLLDLVFFGVVDLLAALVVPLAWARGSASCRGSS